MRTHKTQISKCIFLWLLIVFGIIFEVIIYVSFDVLYKKKLDNIEWVKRELIALNETLQQYQLVNERGKANGYVPLDENEKIPLEFLDPSLFKFIRNLGCWNASSNSPTIISGEGENGELYTVCSPGSSEIDGETEWNFQDELIFLEELNRWVRLDGGIQNINQLGTGARIFQNDSFHFGKLGVKRLATGFDLFFTEFTSFTENKTDIQLSLNRDNLGDGQVNYINVGDGIPILVNDSPPTNHFLMKTLVAIPPMEFIKEDNTALFLDYKPRFTFPDYSQENEQTPTLSTIGFDSFPTPQTISYGVPGITWNFIFTESQNGQTPLTGLGTEEIYEFEIDTSLISTMIATSLETTRESSCISIAVPRVSPDIGPSVMAGASINTGSATQSIGLVRSIKQPGDALSSFFKIGAHCAHFKGGDFK